MTCLESRHLQSYLSDMEILLEKQQEALAERKSVMHEFLRLKARACARTSNETTTCVRKIGRLERHCMANTKSPISSLMQPVGDEAS